MAGGENVESDASSLMAICKEFGGNTSMHGIGRALNNRNPCSRFLWSVITVLGLGASVYQFVLTVTDFYSYPVTTVVSVKQETKVPFPGITICNLNRRRKSKIDPDLVAELFELTEPEASPNHSVVNWIMRDTVHEEEESAHQLEDMLIKRVFNRRVCNHENFKELSTILYGTCFSFEANQLFNYSTRPGPKSGLILELNIEQNEYLPITYEAGVQVLTRRLPSPYSSCTSAYGKSSSQPIDFSNKKYNQRACIKSCYQDFLIEECQCCDADIPCECKNSFTKDGATLEGNCTYPYCDSEESVECQIDVENNVMNGDVCDEDCPPACDSTTYDTVVSTALWPSDGYFDVFIKKVNLQAPENMTSTSKSAIQQFVRSNFLRLEIFLENFEVTEIVAVPKYDWNMLLGNIGGQLGLWLGFSLLTALEIAELLIDAMWFFLRRLYKKKTPTPAGDS